MSYGFVFNSVSYDPATGSYYFDSGSSVTITSISSTSPGFDTQLRWASNTISVNISGLTAPEQQLAVAALAQWADVAPLTFTFTSGAADITYVDSGAGLVATTTDTVTPSGQSLEAETVDISQTWFDTDGGTMDGRTSIGSYDFQTYLARTGRALGVGTESSALVVVINGSGSQTTNPAVDDRLAGDTLQYSVLSASPQNNFGGSQYDYAVSPQRDDISAVQAIYGAAVTRPGDTVYGFHSTAGAIYDFSSYAGLGAPVFTIYDTGGTNTLDASGYSMDQVIDLESGTSSSIGGYVNNIYIYWTTTVQNAVGGFGNDLIIASPNADGTLTGGGGNDTFQGSFTGLSGTTIADMSAGDRIRFIDPSAFDGFGFERDGTTLTYADIYGLQALTLSNSPAGHFVPVPFVSYDQQGNSTSAIDLVLTNPTSTSDFSDSGFSDILWRDQDGTLVDWGMRQGSIVSNKLLNAAPGASWSIAQTADFNGDGNADVLWRDSDGALIEWLMNGGQITASQSIAAAPDASWSIAEVGDFDGNGKSDLLWRQAGSGVLVEWQMDGSQITSNQVIGATPDGTWQVQSHPTNSAV